MTTTTNEVPQLLTLGQACELLALNKRTLYREIQRKRFPALIKNGRMSRVLASAVARYIAALSRGENPDGRAA